MNTRGYVIGKYICSDNMKCVHCINFSAASYYLMSRDLAKVRFVELNNRTALILLNTCMRVCNGAKKYLKIVDNLSASLRALTTETVSSLHGLPHHLPVSTPTLLLFLLLYSCSSSSALALPFRSQLSLWMLDLN